MKKLCNFFIVMGFFLTVPSFCLFAQVGINAGNTAPDNSAMLDVQSTTKGMLIPRMTTNERDAIVSPAAYLMILNTTTRCFEGYNSVTSGWETIHCFECPLPVAPTAGTHLPLPAQITWNWNTVANATGYKWNTVNDYATATDMVAATAKTETGLTCNTAYTRFAWAYNVCGNSTPVTLAQTTSACVFTCGSSITDSRDNKVYTTVLIGSQCWIKQNLNIGTKILGSVNQTDNGIIEKYCLEDLESYCDTYGGFYQWNEMMQYLTTPGGQGICPTGWHIPTDAQWTAVTTFLGGESVAGGKMKTTGTKQANTGLWNSPNTGATNESGFSALPAGRFNGGWVYDTGYNGRWWSSTDVYGSYAYYRDVNYNDGIVSRSNSPKSNGLSVRCLRDL